MKTMTLMAVAWLAAACGSSGGGGATFSTSISGSTKLADLTTAQSQTLCNELKSYASTSTVFKDALEGGCRIAGLFGAAFSGATTDSDIQKACKAAYDACKAEPVDTSSVSSNACTVPSTTCQATIAELIACMNAQFAQLETKLAAIPSCDKLTKTSFTGDAGVLAADTPPAACQTLYTKCPEAKE